MNDNEPPAKAGVTLVPAAAVHALIAETLTKTGLPVADANRVAALMTEGDLTGADAHGVFRLAHYCKRIAAGGINTQPNIEVERTAPATAMVDGDNGMGHLVMSRAAETAIELARESGVAWVGVRRSNHAGPAGLYAAMPVAHDMIGIYSAVASANHMPVWGGADPLLGTNPVAFGIPAGAEPPVILDIATTTVSYGTVKAYAMAGKQMPEGWMIDATDGTPLTDPRRSAEGLLLPLGGYKGSGLALVLGLIGGPLNRALFGADVIDFNADASSETNTGHFILALDIARFTPVAAFKAEVDRHLRALKASKPLPGFDPIRLPGERRAACKAERTRTGIPIPAALMTQLDEVAGRVGVRKLAGR